MQSLFFLNIIIIISLVSLVVSIPLKTFKQENNFKLEDYKFDLNNLKPNNGSGGGKIRALTVDQMKSLKGQGISIIYIEIEPCGVNLPNIHTRASELVYVIYADRIAAGFIPETGDKTVLINELKTGEVTIFPVGTVHFIQNIACTIARLLTSLGNEDPGFITLSKAEFSLPHQILESNYKLSKEKIKSIQKNLPNSLAIGNKECLKRCGL
jgi:hypothetical protein